MSISTALPRYCWLETGEMMPDYVSNSGWAQLVRELLRDIDDVVARTDTKLQLLQIKEKLGGLRVYYRLVNAEPFVAESVADVVNRGCRRSRATCFKCGQAASMRNLDGWIVPTCDRHALREAFE